MEVLVFAHSKDPAKDRFLQTIAKVTSLSPTLVLEEKRFVSLLKNSPHRWKAIVFFVHEPDDLTLALLMKPYLDLSRVIMVLPDWDANGVQEGLSLSPTLMTKADGDFSDIVAVLDTISTLAPLYRGPSTE